MLDDVSRTVLEAIDRRGPITARQAGAIVYRFRGFELLLAVPGPWLASAGRHSLGKLEAFGLVRSWRGRWLRVRAEVVT